MFGDNAETFANYLRHTFSAIEKSECPLRHCDHCDSEKYGLLYSEKPKTTFTGKDLTNEQFNVMMVNQVEQLGEEFSMMNTMDSMNGNPAIRIGEYDDGSTSEERGSSAASQSIRSPTSPSVSFKSQSLRCSSQGSSASSRERMGSTWSNAKFQDNNSKREKNERSKSVGFQEEVSTTPASSGSTRSNRSNSRSVPGERRVASAMPNVGRGRPKIVLPNRPKTATSVSYLAKRSDQFDYIKSRYSRETYVPYNPYRGASFAKNGCVMSFYSKSGYLPRKPFPNDRGFAKVSWDSQDDTRRQKVPSHREIKYMRDGN